ncbi:MAG: hypothetical protein TRG1_3009 [Flavobacteriaceae bacterium FS1-H7996/R]|nr:MAG: hypothetical protein TRG1_3009 [Flavobacteriaceae bacterium FS1-H7996/R]
MLLLTYPTPSIQYSVFSIQYQYQTPNPNNQQPNITSSNS